MDSNDHRRVLKEVNDNSDDIPEATGVVKDSGLASIAGSVSVDDNSSTPIAQDVKFYTINVEEMAVDKHKLKRKVINTVDDEARKKAEEEYNNQKREQVYKRLMHLLTKSKFYASYICDKINVEGKGKKKSKNPKNNENVQTSEKSIRPSQLNKKTKIKNYVSSDMKKKLNDQSKKMNLSEEDIENALHEQSDSEKNKKETDPSVAEFVPPKYFKGSLRDYQIKGLQWLKVLYENGVNGILADEMGLGKTIQVIALFAHLLEKRQNGPYLIIAPLSTIPNWLMEFEKFAPNLPVVLFHGNQEVRPKAKRQMSIKHKITDTYSTYPIILTTYEIPLLESTFLSRFKWRYIVIDEGHRIKNHQCQLLKVLHRCDSLNRLLLTGTPLQNNLAELWSLLNFLLPEIFDDLAVFESWFNVSELQMKGTEKVLKDQQDAQVLASLREILKPFMLRRMKTDVCLDIPPRKELIVYAPLTQLQHDLYAAVLNHDLQVLSKLEEQGVEEEAPLRSKRRCLERNQYSSSYQDINNILHRPRQHLDENNYDSNVYGNSSVKRQTVKKDEDKMRLDVWQQYTDVNDRNRDFFIRLRFGSTTPMYKQIVNHPWLLHCPLDSAGNPEISEKMVTASGKLLVLDAMLKKLKTQGHKVLLFSTMTMILDIIADYLTMRPWEFLMLTGADSIATREANIKLFNEDPDVFIFLISTRAGGVGLNLAGADTVIIYDSDWNPQADLQAMARCHRIGQTRPVVVYKLCTKGTVDERIIARADAKRKLEKMVISKELALDLKKTETLLGLQHLLNSTDNTIVSAEKEVYTEAELDKILDRSDLTCPTQKEISSTEDSSKDS